MSHPHRKVQWEVPHDDFPGGRCLSVFSIIWLSCLSIAVVLLWSISIDKNAARNSTPDLILKKTHPHEKFLQEKENKTMHTYPFNLVDGMMGEVIRLPAKGSLPIEFNKLAHYYVCCHTRDRSYFVCHSVTRNIGIDCVIRREKTSRDIYAAILVQHPDMFGSTCVLNWEYKSIN